MAIRLREAPSSRLDLYLLGSVFVLALFGHIASLTGDWTAAAFSAVGGVATVWLGGLRLRLFLAARRRAPEADAPVTQALVAAAVQPAARVETAQAFVSRASHFVGGRFREGFVVVGRDAAAFVPTSDWRFIAFELLMGLVASRVSLSKLDVDARESPQLAAELAALVQQRGGLMLDGSWAWVRRGVMLSRSQGAETLTLRETPSQDVVGRWEVLPVDPAARQRVVRRVGVGAMLVAFLLTAIGCVATAMTGDSDYLVAGLSYGVLIGGAAAVPLFLMRGGRRSATPRG